MSAGSSGLFALLARVVAVAGPRRCYLMPDTSALPNDDRRRRLVVLMCVRWHRMSSARRSGPLTYQKAEAYARYVLAKLDEAARGGMRSARERPTVCPTAGYAFGRASQAG